MIPSLTKQNAQFDKLVNKLANYSAPSLILGGVLADIFITCIFNFILFPNHTAGPNFKADIEGFIIVVLAAPLLETWIFQTWILKGILKYTNNNKLLAISISSILFGLGHHYSIPYILKATLAGSIYGVLYLSILDKKKNPFFYIVITHSIYNFIGFIITYFDKS